MPFQGAKEKYILPRGDTPGYKIEGFQPSCIKVILQANKVLKQIKIIQANNIIQANKNL